MTILILLALLRLTRFSTGIVTSNDDKTIACPEFSITEESTIASPMYPEYHANFYCEYSIQAPKNRYVDIHFESFSFPERSSAKRGINYERIFPRCEKDFLEISDDYQYINKFRYCHNELDKKEFVSQGNSVKLILQMMRNSQSFTGFKATVKFPISQNFGVVDRKCSPKGNLMECRAPLKRVMTPESSVVLDVNHRGRFKTCSKEMTLTKNYLSYVPNSLGENTIMILDNVKDNCLHGMRYPTVMHLTEPDTIVYQVSTQEENNFDVILKQFSTQQIKKCGGDIYLQRGQTHELRYGKSILQKSSSSCLWNLHADPTADKIKITISTFDFAGANDKCANHHLSMMHSGVNMFEILQHDVKNKKTGQYRRICNKISGQGEVREFVRPNRDVYGSLSVMVLLSHSENFADFKAEIKSLEIV